MVCQLRSDFPIEGGHSMQAGDVVFYAGWTVHGAEAEHTLTLSTTFHPLLHSFSTHFSVTFSPAHLPTHPRTHSFTHSRAHPRSLMSIWHLNSASDGLPESRPDPELSPVARPTWVDGHRRPQTG